MGFFDRFKKTANQWFQEAQNTVLGARDSLMKAAMRDVERVRQGLEQREHAALSANIRERVSYCIERALQADPAFSPAWFFKGEHLVAEGKLDEAILCLDKVTKTNPGFADAFYYKGEALYKKEAYDKALIAYERALEINPNDAGALMGKSYILNKQGKAEEAAACSDKAKQLDPSFAKNIRVVLFDRWLRIKA